MQTASPERLAAAAGAGSDLRRSILGRSLLFERLTQAQLDAVLERAAHRRVARGAPILRRGDASAALLVVATGRARVGLTSEEGREVTLDILGPGEVLGEMSLLDGEPCSADVTAHEDCTLLAIERSHVLGLLRADGELCLRLLAAMAGRLRRANASIEEIALLDLSARLGRLLIRLARDFGEATPRGRRIGFALSQRELGTLVGGSREQVNKLLRQWEESGAIGKDGKRIVLRRPDRLGPET